MVIEESVKKVIEESAFLVLITVCPDGTPHPIVAGKGTVSGGNVIFNIHKMEQTRKNILGNSKAQALCATLNGAPQGFRLSGTAAVAENAEGKQLVLCVDRVDSLI
ncbi:MAG: pyridoxamine 5'-phosphate oxidase family protein [Spirochaetaceae bacterium]|jgi:predicted pyridoxine 5'-phosphate oxidase superfamily flavin-nucleotide-binding protein|nr:pyridoxamine 5'-phosphate oxidase family protein [Spirochaetaceae bacterium]